MARTFSECQADQICRSMESLRVELDSDVHQVRRSAATLSDWQYYLRTYPWASVGIAVAIGFLVVPRKLKMTRPDTESLEKLIHENTSVSEHQGRNQTSNGALRTTASFVTSLAVKAVAAQLAHYLAGHFVRQESAENGGSHEPATGRVMNSDHRSENND